MHELTLLTVVITAAALLALVVKRLRQPLLVSYIAVGAILSAFHIVKPEELEFIAILPEIGLALLLFLVGMELDLKEFKSVGKKVVIATLGQVAFTVGLFFVLLQFFGMPPIQAIILGLAISFSSTILVIKLLIERQELASLHGKLSVGILLVEDLIAVVALMLMSVVGSNGGVITPVTVLLLLGKGALLLAVSLIAGHKLLPRIFKASADNSELLFLVPISWCLLFVALASYFEFSLAIGAFLAGVSLAQSTYRLQISSKVKPLRDFFIMLFFLDLGTGLSISGIQTFLPLAILFIVYAVIIKPLFFFVMFTFFKFKAHPAFLTGIVISSISEFSLILVSQASKVGLVDEAYMSPLIFATVFSFVISSLLSTNSRKLYLWAKPVLHHWQKRAGIADHNEGGHQLSGHVILIGCHRSGQIVLKGLQRLYGENIMVVDFNPEVIDELKAACIPCLYGDISDPEIQDLVNLKEADLVVSTVRSFPDNLALLDGVERTQSKATVIITATDSGEAVKLYERGAHHVSIPVSLEGLSISRLISDYHGNFKELQHNREKKLGDLKRSVHD